MFCLKNESHTSFLRLIINISYNDGTVGLFQAVYTIAPIVVAGNVFASGLLHWEIDGVGKYFAPVGKEGSNGANAHTNLL